MNKTLIENQLPPVISIPPVMPPPLPKNNDKKYVLMGVSIFFGFCVLMGGCVLMGILADKVPSPGSSRNIADYNIHLTQNVTVLDVKSYGARVETSNGDDMFLLGLDGVYSGRCYDLRDLYLKDIDGMTYTTVNGSQRRIPAYEVWKK